jgi:hypothetical protein
MVRSGSYKMAKELNERGTLHLTAAMKRRLLLQIQSFNRGIWRARLCLGAGPVGDCTPWLALGSRAMGLFAYGLDIHRRPLDALIDACLDCVKYPTSAVSSHYVLRPN